MSLNSPSLILESSMFTPAAWISTRTSLSPGSGSGISPNRRAPLFLYRSTMKAFIRLLLVLLRSKQCQRGIGSRSQYAVRQRGPGHGAGQLKRADEGCKDAECHALGILCLRRKCSRHFAHQCQEVLGVELARFGRLAGEFGQECRRCAAFFRIVAMRG